MNIKWLGFPALIQVDATDRWEVCRGTFTVPVLVAGETHQENKVAASMVVGDGSALFLDDFRVWPVSPPAAGTK